MDVPALQSFHQSAQGFPFMYILIFIVFITVFLPGVREYVSVPLYLPDD